MITRRDFIKLAAATPIGVALRTPPMRPVRTQSQIERVGVGLFTIPKSLEEDFSGTMARLATIGYKEVELFGPCPYTVPEVVAS
ncbi:MAG: twin-arginine translocation signal domain-containing protein [Bacteroidota bacterium]|nr:twin-arginine translocation signal domain-containing protein [Bacteroidota bacterium]